MSGGGGGGSQTVGFKYYFGIHMGICRGEVDEIVAARVGDQNAWQGSITESGLGKIAQPDLFGGEKKEGGIDGIFDVMMGESTQTVNDRPVAEILTPGVIPGFRRMLTIYFDGLISAMNPYPKKWSWRVRRAVKGWDGEVLAPELAVITLGGAPPTYIDDVVVDLLPYDPPVYDPIYEGGGGASGDDYGDFGGGAEGGGDDSSGADGDNSNGEA